jgi:hypothetical protein
MLIPALHCTNHSILVQGASWRRGYPRAGRVVRLLLPAVQVRARCVYYTKWVRQTSGCVTLAEEEGGVQRDRGCCLPPPLFFLRKKTHCR